MKSSRGFTLIELMVAITILGILLGLSIPSFRELTRRNRATATQNDLVTSLNLARSEALRRNRPVAVCASADGASCGAATDWVNGWIAFTDRGAVGALDGTDELLQFWPGPGATMQLNGTASYVRYAATGMADGGLTVEVRWDTCTGQNLRRVTVMPSGSIIGQKTNC